MLNSNRNMVLILSSSNTKGSEAPADARPSLETRSLSASIQWRQGLVEFICPHSGIDKEIVSFVVQAKFFVRGSGVEPGSPEGVSCGFGIPVSTS